MHLLVVRSWCFVVGGLSCFVRSQPQLHLIVHAVSQAYCCICEILRGALACVSLLLIVAQGTDSKLTVVVAKKSRWHLPTTICQDRLWFDFIDQPRRFFTFLLGLAETQSRIFAYFLGDLMFQSWNCRWVVELIDCLERLWPINSIVLL